MISLLSNIIYVFIHICASFSKMLDIGAKSHRKSINEKGYYTARGERVLSSLRPAPRPPLRERVPCGGRRRPRALYLHSLTQKIKETLKNITSHVDRPVRGFVGRCSILIIWACSHICAMLNRVTEKVIETTTPKHYFPYHIAVIIITIIGRRRSQLFVFWPFQAIRNMNSSFVHAAES